MPAGLQSSSRLFLPQMGLQKQGLWRRMVWRQPTAGAVAAFSPDGSWFAACTGFFTLAIFRTADGEFVRFIGANVGVTAPVACSPDGKLLATGGLGNRIHLWRVKDGNLTGTIITPDADITCLCFSPDGTLLASCQSSYLLCLWDVRQRRLRWKVRSPFEQLTALAFSPHGDTLTASGWGGYIVVRTQDGVILRRVATAVTITRWNRDFIHRPLDGPFFKETCDARLTSLSSDGKRVAGILPEAAMIGVWDVHRGQQVARIHISRDYPVEHLTLSPDGNTLAFPVSRETVEVWSVPQERRIRTLHTSGRRAESVRFSPDGTILALCEGETSLWRVRDGSKLYSLYSPSETALALSPDGRVAATGDTQNNIRFWRTTDGALLRTWQEGSPHDGYGSPSYILDIAFSPDGSQLAALTSRGIISLWRVTPDTRLLRRWTGVEGGPGGSLCFSPDGKYLAAVGGAEEYSVWLWDARTGKLVKRLCAYGHGCDNWLHAVRFSPNGRILAVAGREISVKLWDVSSGRLLREIQDKDCPWVYSIAFSPDGAILAVPSLHEIRLWRVRDGRLVRRLRDGRMAEAITDVVFSSNGQMLAASYRGGGVRIWRVRDRRLLHILPVATGRIHFLPESTHLVTGGGFIALWRL